MCGICGAFDLRYKASPDEGVIRRMLEKIKHRGPDGEKLYMSEGIALGFNRLSFLDLEGGMQPLANENDDIIMVCNGEIFNYRELRDELTAEGHIFSTNTDVEVILHLYEKYGEEFPSKLNGQFAIALYDKSASKLLLVRDQMGICPVFYSVIGDTLVFASEIKGILEYPGAPRKLNLKALDQLMNFPGVVSPDTFFRDIYQVKPGHMLRYSTGKPERSFEDIEYWDLIYSEEQEDLGESYYVEELRRIIKESISRRLIADVPIGFYISGGLDSSVVACYIGEYLMDSAYSFSAEIGSGELDESLFQSMVKEKVNSTHYSTKINEGEIWDNLQNVIYHAESAVKESYDTAAYLLSGLVKGSPAKAVLTGQGSDELFCGYVGYMVDLFRNMQKDSMSTEEKEINERLWGDPYFRYERNHHEIRQIHKRLYSRDVIPEMKNFSALNDSPVNISRLKGLSSQKRRSYIDCKLRLGDHLLGEHGDRMFFSHSVEGRHPFLDAELISFVAGMPDKYKLRGANEKYILKKAGEGIVPDAILKRKKFPFQAPGMSSLIKKKTDSGFLSDELIKKQGIFDPGFVSELKGRYLCEDFVLMGAYEVDYLMIVLTTTMLCEMYSLSL